MQRWVQQSHLGFEIWDLQKTLTWLSLGFGDSLELACSKVCSEEGNITNFHVDLGCIEFHIDIVHLVGTEPILL